MSASRADKVAAAIQEELAELIRRQVKDVRVHAAGILTVTRVEVSRDCSVARIWVSFVGGDDAKAQAAVEGLERAAGFLRGEIGRNLQMRHAPDLRFQLDTTGELIARIDAAVKGDQEQE